MLVGQKSLPYSMVCMGTLANRNPILGLASAETVK